MKKVNLPKSSLVIVNAEFVGFLAAAGKDLIDKYDYKVSFLVRDKVIKDLINEMLPNHDNIIIRSEIFNSIKPFDVLEEANRIEKQYSIRLAMHLSFERGLGQGYLFNVQKHPDMIRASWQHLKKLKIIISQILCYEEIINNYQMVISFNVDRLVHMICQKRSIGCYCLAETKCGDLYFWTDNQYNTSSNYIKNIKERLQNYQPSLIDKKYKIGYAGNMINKQTQFNLKNSIKISINRFLRDTYQQIKGTRPKNGYRMYGWVAPQFRRVLNHKYIKRISVKPEDIANYRIVYFPLHMEPEVSLLYYSPEFTNSMEAITWLSKSLPADTLLVIKEQVNSFAVRSRWYYKTMNKIGNVVWADPGINSWEWIEKSDITVSITGSAMIEAIHMQKPVISFGKHNIVNLLPSVKYVSNYDETLRAIESLLVGKINDAELEKSVNVLHQAQIDISFELEGFEDTLKSRMLQIDHAKIAIENMVNKYE